jgi:peptidoglycan hydrolase-like protein with peptidoglycan-binding domain
MTLWLVLLALFVACSNAQMPCPFNRTLTLQDPPLSGKDVYILQNMLLRAIPNTPFTSTYDAKTQAAVLQFQSNNKIDATGTFDETTANLLLENYMDDGYKDDGTIPDGVAYKVHIEVYRNRSIETQATLYSGNGTILHVFTVRTAGENDNTTGIPLNQLCDDGSTPTGLITFDLNSPEDDPISFGPYPVNRAVQGLIGNAAIVISDIRDGILLHTGEWSNWNPSMPMPNSHGCVHAHPTDVEEVWHILVSLGVKVHPNTFGALPYPYPTQGLLSIEQLD